jgi:hypothetical protein
MDSSESTVLAALDVLMACQSNGVPFVESAFMGKSDTAKYAGTHSMLRNARMA